MEIEMKLSTRQSRKLLQTIKQLSGEKQNMEELIATLMNTIEKQQKDNQQQIAELNKRIADLELVNMHQKEIIDARNKRLFGRKSEQLSSEELQYWLFNELEAVLPEKVKLCAETLTVKEHTRAKRGRKSISDALPRVEFIHDLADAEKQCPHCLSIRPRLGEDIHEEVSIIPLQVFVKKHIYPKYGPCGCQGGKADKDAKPIIRAQSEKRVIPGSMADEIMLAYLAVSKFCDSLPFYRQEQIMRRYGIEYGRETMCTQMIGISRACSELLELMWAEARSGPILNMDETVIQVLHEPGREPSTKSWMWVMVGRPEGKRVILFHYHQKRSGEVARKLLEGYSGYLQADGYSAYHVINDNEKIISVGCWAHVRRKYIESQGISGYESQAGEALAMIAKLFHIDNVLRQKDLSENDFVGMRRQQSQPILDELYCWLGDRLPKVPSSFNLYKAIRYTMGEWPRLIRYLDHAYLTPDNNPAENAIRPFVVGRKNWLFANTPGGAHASAALYSLVESAKANGLDPFDYLAWLFTELPKTPTEKLHDILPHVVVPAKVNGFVASTKLSSSGSK